MTWVWEHSTHKEGSLLVLLAIADIADDEGKAWPSIARIAAKARLSERQTQYILRSLETSGELSVDRGGGRHHTNVFWVNVGKGADTAPFQRETVQVRANSGAVDGCKTDKGATTAPIETVQVGAETERSTSTAPFKRVQSTVTERKGAVGDIERVQFGAEKGAIAIAPEPSIEPSIEPSLINIVQKSDFPEWFKTLSQDPRWHGKDPIRYIKSIEQAYSNINLDLEAHNAYEWLQSSKGQKKKVLRGFWINWLKNSQKGGRNNNGEPEDNSVETKLEEWRRIAADVNQRQADAAARRAADMP